MKGLTQKQENFTLNLLNDVPQREAWGNAGYSTNYSLAVIDVNASRLANSTKIQLRLAELRAQVADKAVMSLQEMLKTHTEIARARIGGFLDEGQRIRQGADLNNAGIQELETQDVKIGKGENARLAKVTRLKLLDPVRSMQEIARLQGHYPKEASITYNDIKVLIVREKPKDAVE